MMQLLSILTNEIGISLKAIRDDYCLTSESYLFDQTCWSIIILLLLNS